MEMVWLLVICCFLGYIFILLQRKKTKWPPGPQGLPLLGNIHQLDINNCHKIVTEWNKQYGDVVHFKILTQDVLVVSGYDETREILLRQSTEFGDRVQDFRLKYFYNSSSAVNWRNISPDWSDMKKNMLSALKWYGSEHTKLEALTKEILEELVFKITEKKEEAFDPTPIFHESLNSILASVVVGVRLPTHMVEGMAGLIERFSSFCRAGGPGSEFDIFPWLRHIPYSNAMKNLRQFRNDKDTIFKQVLSFRKESFDPALPSSFIDQLFVLQEKERKTQGHNTIYTDDYILGAMVDVMLAGTGTSLYLLLCIMSLLVNFPELQARIQNSLLQVLGTRTPQVSDRKSLPYIEAFIMEAMRYTAFLPINPPHATSEGATLHGQPIPPKTWVWINNWYQFHDERFWEDPWSFRPERFLDEDGQLLPPDHPIRSRFMPFGAGRRVCPGESLAKNRLFLFIATLLLRFTFKVPEGATKPMYDPRQFKLGFGICPDPYTIIAVPRDHI